MGKILFLLLVLSQLAMGSWSVSTYRDSFGELTKNKLVINNGLIEGTYRRNSERKLYVNMQINQGGSAVGIFLHQDKANNKSERFTMGRLIARNEKGEDFFSGIREWNDTEGIKLLKSQEFISFLKRSNTVRVIVEERLFDSVWTTYSFTINAVGLNQKLKEIGL